MVFKDIFRRAGKDKVLTDLGVRDFADISRRLQKVYVSGTKKHSRTLWSPGKHMEYIAGYRD